MAKRFPPGTEKTTGRHRRRPDGESHSRRKRIRSPDSDDVVGRGKEEVDEAEPEEGDVPQSSQTTTVTVVAAHPVFFVEVQANHCT